jgi:hypothetical protein
VSGVKRVALPCGCSQESFMGQKRPTLCDHGNLFEKPASASKPRRPLKRTQRRETAAERRARDHFNDVVKSWRCWFSKHRPCGLCHGGGEIRSHAGYGATWMTCFECGGVGKHNCTYPKDAHHLIPKDFIRQRYRGIASEEKLLAVLFNPLIGAPLCRKAHDAIEAGSDHIYWEDLSEECLEYVSGLPDFMLLRLERECPKREAVSADAS